MRKIILVLGMHRSATSLTTEILSSYGLFIGETEDLCKPNQSNQRGFFENKYAVRLNNRILYEHRMHWAEVHKNENIVWETKYLFEINEVLNNMIAKAEDAQMLLLKDPRMCITEPVWKKQMDVLGIEEHIAMVFRHPYEVAKSLAIRDNMNFTYAMKLWFYYNYCALCRIAACNTSVLVLNHDDYFSAHDEQIKKIEDFLRWTGTNRGLDKIIDVSLRHNNVKEIYEEVSPELEAMVFELYQYLVGLSLMKETVSNEKLSMFSGFLKKIINTAYLPDNNDIPPKVFKNALGKEKKQWCMYQLENNRRLLVSAFRQMRDKEKLEEVSVYGNGTLAGALLPLLELAAINVVAVYDRNPMNTRQQIKVFGIYEKDFVDGVILNTAVNYGDQVKNELLEKFKSCRVLDLYELLYGMLYIMEKPDMIHRRKVN